jgi:uncharacterized protein YaaQ
VKLIIAVVHDEDKNKVIDAFNENNLRITMTGTTGGFIRSGNSTLLSGVEDDELEKALNIIANNTEKREENAEALSHRFLPMKPKENNSKNIAISGATVFVVNVDRFVKF